MPTPDLDKEPVRIRFGAGRNTQALLDEVGEQECIAGENFVLTLGSNIMKPRGPLEIVGTTPNAGEILGFAQLQKQDGTLHTLIHSGTGLYSWDGTPSGFTLKKTVSASALLRGPLEANFTLDEVVIITDLNRVEEVMTYDGTTVAKLTTTLSPDEFYAKYCIVELGRAIFANVADSASSYPHIAVISAVEDKNTITDQRPLSASSDDQSVFIPSPNLSPINGLASGFGKIVFGTDRKTYYLTGSGAQDYAITELHEGSGVSGTEGLINIGNDVLIPDQGRIDTLQGTDRFGNVATDDLSREIADEIASEKNWQSVYDPTTQRIYLMPDSGNKIHVFHKSLYDLAIASPGSRLTTRNRTSAWSKFTTKLSFGFSSSCFWRMKDPIDGILKVYCGDTAGNIYQFEGDGSLDGGVNDIAVFRESRSFSVVGGDIYNIDGELKYRRPSTAQQCVITLQYNGDRIFSETITITMQELTSGSYFGGSVYFGGEYYFGNPTNIRSFKHKFKAPAGATDVSVRVAVDATDSFGIEEVALRVSSAETRP